MSAITGEHDDLYGIQRRGGTCNMCAKKLYYPFLHWESLVVCGSCCQKIKSGLMADLIHIAAITDLYAVNERYRCLTFVRTSTRSLEERHKREQAEIAKMEEHIKRV